MSNVFEKVSDKLKNSGIVLWIFSASVLMLVIGLNHFVEDTLSSKYGIEQIQNQLGLIAYSYEMTLWTMSLAPQVGQIIFAYVFLSDTENNKWAAFICTCCWGIDFITDVFYRSNQDPFKSFEAFIGSVLITLIFFTLGSEGFITIGIGLVMELFPSFIVQIKRLFLRITDALFSKKGGRSTNDNPL